MVFAQIFLQPLAQGGKHRRRIGLVENLVVQPGKLLRRDDPERGVGGQLTAASGVDQAVAAAGVGRDR